MSRVSEALERASAERAELNAQGPNGREDPAELTSGVNGHEVTDLDFRTRWNGEFLDPPQRLVEPRRPFGKRIQSFLFGHGLKKVKEFPLVFDEKNSRAGEQYKMLREQIKKIHKEGSHRVLAIMSPVKGDGKSTVASNLAAIIALEYAQQVLLIDADLRNPSIHNFFGLSSGPGLGDYLTSSSPTPISNYVRNTSLPNLRVLPAGRPIKLSPELLATERMRSLITEFPTDFPGYQVIIDTSPVLSTSDPLVIARQVDNIIMVIRADSTPRDCLTEAIRLLGSDRIKGLVLNGAKLGPGASYYYYSD